MSQEEQDSLKKVILCIAEEITRGILRPMRHKITVTKIGRLVSETIGLNEFEKLKQIVSDLQQTSMDKCWKHFVETVPGITRGRKSVYSVKKGSHKSKEIILENQSIEEYRQNILCEVISMLLNNSDINYQGQNNNTVLHLIASLPVEEQETRNFQIDLMKLLIEAKANRCAKNAQDMTALHIIAGNYLLDSQKGYVPSGRPGLTCEENTIGRLEKLKCLEVEIKKPFSDRGPGGNSILHEWTIYCTRFNDLTDTEVSIGKWMTRTAKVDPNVVNDRGCTPLHYAFTDTLVDFMCENGSAKDRQNMNGDTPLMCIIKDIVLHSLPNTQLDDGTSVKEAFANYVNIPREYSHHLMAINPTRKLNFIDFNVFQSNDFNLMATDDIEGNCLDFVLSSITFMVRHSDIIPDSMVFIRNLVEKWLVVLTTHDGTAVTRIKTLSVLITVFFELGNEAQTLITMILSHIEYLLKDGADPNQTRFYGGDPVLHYCCKNVNKVQHLQLVKILCEYGANKALKDRQGNTLDRVLHSGPYCEDILKVLNETKLKRRVNIDIQSIRYKSSLEVLCCQPYPKRIQHCLYDSNIIGKGAMSCIYLSIDERCKREMALKRIEKHVFQKEVKSEIEALKKLEQNQNIVNFYFPLEEDDFYFLAIELMDGDLASLVKEKEMFLANPDNNRKLAGDIVCGLSFLHKHNMVHRDIKPGNVLYREKPEFCLKLADFGLTKHLDAAFSVNQTSVFTTASTSLCGTRGWMAPELVKRTQNTHSKESDMYALGLLLHFLFSKGFHPFHSSTVKLLDSISTGSLKAYELETNISKGNGHIRKDLTPEQNHLVLCLLSEDPKKRPSSVDLKKHHCYFWTNMKKVKFMWAIGDQKEVAKPSSCPNSTLGKNLQSTQFGQAVMRDSWNVNISALFQEVTSRGRGNIDTNSVLGLIRFFRNAYAHYEERSPDRKDELLNDHFFKTFPEFFVVVWTEVYNQGWMNLRGSKLMLLRIIQEID